MMNQYGHRLVERGYAIIPLLAGKKNPPASAKNWQKLESTPELVAGWIEQNPDFGIGVLCATTCAVDMDCRDKALNNKMLHWLKDNVGLGAIRVGDKPKCIVPYRNEERFNKIKSAEFQDADGVKHVVEILGNGQQFVAYGIHPKTVKPYEWVSGPTLADVFYDDLPELTSEKAHLLIEFFESQAKGLGWEEVKPGSRQQAEEQDALMNLKATMDIGPEEVMEIVNALDPDDHHDNWIRVGMSLHHQYGGSMEGLQIWDEWSAQGSKYQGDGECIRRWQSFGDYQGSPVTMASLKYQAKKCDSVEVVEEELPSMLKNWAFIQVEGSARVLREELDSEHVMLFKTEDLKKEYANREVLDDSGRNPRMVNLVDLWLKHPDRRTYPAGICFAPDNQVLKRYNLWRGWSYRAVEGEMKPFFDFVTQVIASGSKEHAHYIMGWCAQMIQKPQSKMGVGLVLRGSKGSGKTFFGELVGGLFKPHHRIVSKAEHVTGKFNRHLEDTLLLQCDEAYWARNKAAEGALKDLLTNSRITVERKGMDSYSSANYTRILFSSNEQWVVPASLDERRFAIFDVSDVKQQDAKYFGALRNWYNRGGAEHMLHFFKHFDLTTVDVRKAPRTAALDEQKLHSLDSVDQWLLDCITAGEFREQKTHGEVFEFAKDEPKSGVYQCYVSSVKGRYENAKKEAMFWRHLHEIPNLIAGECRKRVGTRQVRYVQFVNVDLATDAFNQHHNVTQNVFIPDVTDELDPLDPDNWEDDDIPF